MRVPPQLHSTARARARVGIPILIGAWAVAAVLLNDLPRPMADELALVGRSSSGALFLAAGGLRIARWRLTSEARAAWSGAALLALGAGLPLLPLLADLATDQPRLAAFNPEARLGLVVVVLALLTASLRADTHARVLPPVRVAVGVLILLAMATCLGAVAQHAVAGAGDAGPITGALEVAAAAAWLALARAALGDGMQHAQVTRTWTGWAFVLMAGGELLRLDSLTRPEPLWCIATGVQLAAAALATLSAACELLEAFAFHGARLINAVDTLSQSRQNNRERLHDARSTVFTLTGATAIIGHGGLDDDERRQWSSVMAAELHRLEQVLDPDPVIEQRTFDVAAVIGPVAATYGFAGLPLQVAASGVSAFGDPTATASVIANLLSNAQRHATGATVVIGAVSGQGTTTIWVDDAGGGIPPTDRDRLLLPGERGPGGGTGLGLHTAARMMAAQSGSLHLTDSPLGGTRVVLTLPAAEPAAGEPQVDCGAA